MRTLFGGAVAAVMLAAVPATAAVTVIAGAGTGSTSDPLNGATVRANSALLQGFSVQDAFGAVTPNEPFEESRQGGNVIFADGSQTNFIDFNTTNAVLLQGINVLVASDGATSSDRQFATVTLFAGTSAGALTSLGTATLAPGRNTVAFTFGQTNYQFFRFEGTNLTNGARLIEIDGVAGVPEPATWAMMIAGFGLVGGAMRGARRRAAVAAP